MKYPTKEQGYCEAWRRVAKSYEVLEECAEHEYRQCRSNLIDEIAECIVVFGDPNVAAPTDVTEANDQT